AVDDLDAATTPDIGDPRGEGPVGETTPSPGAAFVDVGAVSAPGAGDPPFEIGDVARPRTRSSTEAAGDVTTAGLGATALRAAGPRALVRVGDAPARSPGSFLGELALAGVVAVVVFAVGAAATPVSSLAREPLALWPPAGVALAAFVLFGNRVSAGVVLG